jgi:hypothetical protein
VVRFLIFGKFKNMNIQNSAPDIFSKTKSNFTLFLNRKQLKKIAFIDKCHRIITERLSFEEALVELPEFLEVIEIVHGTNKISIDNKYGKFSAIWDAAGKGLIYYEFRTRKNIY